MMRHSSFDDKFMWDRWLLLCRGGLLMVFFLMMPVYVTAQEKTVGYINDFTGNDGVDFSITRANLPLKLEKSLPLQKGDEIKILTPTGKIDVQLGNSSKTVTVQNTPYIVPDSTPLPETGFFAVVFGQLGKLVGLDIFKVKLAIARGGPEDDCSQSEDVSIPLLDGKEVKLVEGYRKLAIGWRGGKQPYTVSLVAVDDQAKKNDWIKPEIKDPDPNRCQMTWKEVTFEPWKFEKDRRYSVTVTDTLGRQKTGTFKVVATSEKPVYLKEIPNTSPHLKAMWLVGDNNKNQGWQLEAYQEVSGQKNSFALLVRLGLAEGTLGLVEEKR